MNLLALDASTDTLSLGVSRVVSGQTQQWLHTAAGGAKASVTAIAAIMELLSSAGIELRQLDAICIGAGPGSFTGLRTACAIAQGLAYGAKVMVLPVDTLMAVAEEARAVTGDEVQRVTALLDARMDEMYVASFERHDSGWQTVQGPCLVRPEDLAQWLAPQDGPMTLAGNVFAEYGQRLSAPVLASAQRIEALPSAAAMLRLAPKLLAAGLAVSAEHALPTYVRDKVAQTTLERMQARAAQEAAKAGGLAAQ
jgi:tRNA threonylcarbamoyladenosine biosynthesis protein TsaB